jgi:hypothetical protein
MTEVLTKNGTPLDEVLKKYEPNAYMKIVNKYDIEERFAQYSINCRKSYSREYPPPKEDFPGIKKVEVLNQDQCDGIISHIDAKDVYDLEFRRAVVGTILDNIDKEMLTYFKSEYSPIWIRFYANQPGEDWRDQYSFYWHCDGGPTKHLKLLLYLNSSEDSGGNTEFVDYMTTMDFKSLGYVCCGLEYRLPDLEEFSDRFGICWEPKKLDIAAGEGILFEPFNIMHKGIWPTKAPRYLVQICFVASHNHWSENLKNAKTLTNENAWPKIA